MQNLLKSNIKMLVIFVGLLILTSCSYLGFNVYNMQPLNDKKSYYFFQKDFNGPHYWNRFKYPKIYTLDNNIVIFLYDKDWEYRGFYINLNDYTIANVNSDSRRISSDYFMYTNFYKFKITYKGTHQWPIYWLVINHPNFPKIFFRWEPTIYKGDHEYSNQDIGKLKVMILAKNASEESKEKFKKLINKLDNSETILSEKGKEEEKAEQQRVRAMNAYFSALMGETASQVKNAVHDTLSHDGNGMKIEDIGFTNGKHNYKLYKDGDYDGMVVYYQKDDNFNIFSSGVKQGQSVNGTYFTNNSSLYTPQCGTIKVEDIDEAVKKAVNCIYKRKY